MEVFYGFSDTPSAKISDKYLEINNYGYYKNIENEIRVVRERGRSDYQIIYISAGSMCIQNGKEKTMAQAGSLVLYKPYEAQIYSFLPSEESGYFWFHFSGIESENMVGELFLGASVINVGSAYEIFNTVSDLKHFCIVNDAISRDYAAGRFIMMLAQIKRQTRSTDRKIEEALALINRENYTKSENADYAAAVGLSESHFIRRFKAYTGLTPKRYRLKILMERAAGILSSTDMNITETAFMLGFEDNLYFSRLFKKEFGISPGEFKRGRNP